MDIEKLERTFQALEQLNINDELIYENTFLTFNSINHLPMLTNNLLEGRPVFRTRTHQDNSFFTKVSDVAITPRKFVNEYARCNRPFQSIFYCSENRPTSFMELLQYWSETKKAGEKLYVTTGKWELIKPMNVIIITSPNLENRVSQYDSHHGEGYDASMKNKSEEEIKFSKIFYDYMFEKFRKPAKNDLKTYLITTAYSNLAMTHAQRQNVQADGISYPSVPFENKGINFAIKENFAKNYLRLTNLIRVEFEITMNELGKHSFMEVNNHVTDKIDNEKNLIEW